MRPLVAAALVVGCSSSSSSDSSALHDSAPGLEVGEDSSFDATSDAVPDTATDTAPPFVPTKVALEPIFESATPQKTPPTWNAHLSKLVGDSSFLYAVHTSFSDDVASRWAAIVRRPRGGGSWTEVGRLSYVHQPPGVVLDPGGTLHLVFDCLRPSAADVTCFTGGAGTAGRTSRFYRLAFSSRGSDSALRFDTYANYNEWTAESNGYHSLGLLDDGTVVFSLADSSWNRVVQYRTKAGDAGTIATLSRPSTYLLYPIAFGGPSALGFFAGEFDPKGGTNAGYPAATIFSGTLTGLTERLKIEPLTTVGPGEIGAYPSDVEVAPDGTVYALVYRRNGDQCTELLRFDGGLGATPARTFVGCFETYAKLQLARDGRLFLLTSGDSAGMKLGISADRGATFTFGTLAFDKPLGAGDVHVIGATPVKRSSSPLLHDPDVFTFFAAGLDASGTSKRSYLGTIRLSR